MELFDLNENNSLTQLELEETNLIELYESLHTNTDPYSVRQHMKVIIYLHFIDSYYIYISDPDEFKRRIVLARNYVDYKLFHLYNPERENNPPLYIDTQLIESFCEDVEEEETTENNTPVHSGNLPPLQKISNLIYSKINEHTKKDKKNIKNREIVEHCCYQNEIDNLIYMNKKLLENIKSCSPFHHSSVTNTYHKYDEIEKIKMSIDNTNKIKMDAYILRKNMEQLNRQMQYLLTTKQNSVRVELDKKQCRNTLLFNLEKVKQKLNSDVLNIICEFVGETFIENIRRIGIQRKYFPLTHFDLQTMLLKWKKNDLQKFEKNYLYLRYDLSNVNREIIYSYDDDDYFMYFNETRIYGYFVSAKQRGNIKKQTKNTIVDRILNRDNIENYYPFQRNVWLLTNKIMHFS